MAFAVEAQKLLGRINHVRDSEFTYECRWSRDPARYRSQGERWRGPCHNGPLWVGQEHARTGAGRARGLSHHRRRGALSGEVLYEGNDLLQMRPEARARAEIFLAFQ